MKQIVASTLFFFLFTAEPAIAARFTTFGAPDCGKWITDSSQTRKAWLLGFLSGMSAMHMRTGQRPTDPLDSLSSAEQAYVWMNNYCTKYPLRSVTDGALELFDEIKGQKSVTK